MKKRIIRTLTPKVREKIKKDFGKLRLSDYGDDALVYLRKVKGAAKGRKAKKDKVAKIDDLVVPKDSEMYRIIEAAAKLKKMSVASFMKKHRQDIMDMLEGGDSVVNRETDYLISDLKHLKKGKKVFVNDNNGYVQTNNLQDIYHIQAFTQTVMTTDIFMVFYRTHYKLSGDLSHYLPSPEEYEETEGDTDAMVELLNGYYPEITFLISPSKKQKKGVTKEKRISKADRQRAKKNTNKSNHQRKR